MPDPGDLLAGPRGRRLCLELAGFLARGAATGLGEEYLRAVLSAAYDLDPDRGSSRVRLLALGEGQQDPEPTVTPDDVARLLDAVALDGFDGRVLLDALAAAVDNAGYWQEPDGEDVLATTPAVRVALVRFAALIASSGLATWWATPIDRTRQWSVAFDDALVSPTSLVAGTADEHLSRWRADVVREEVRAQRERPADPRAGWSGTWWSTPPRVLTRTTRGLGALGAVGLWLVEDAPGWDRATVRPVVVPDDANVYEVDGPEAWAQLCRRFPLEVTASRRHDWYRTTGVAGPWVVPDWSRAATAVDAVHLTVTGYLTTAGRPVGVTDSTSSVLAGWNPDETYWLRHVAAATATERTWVRRDHGDWSDDLP